MLQLYDTYKKANIYLQLNIKYTENRTYIIYRVTSSHNKFHIKYVQLSKIRIIYITNASKKIASTFNMKNKHKENL